MPRLARRPDGLGQLVAGVVKGIGGYGNCVGVPTVGGECTFHRAYNGNILVNAMCVGIARADRVFYATASGVRPDDPEPVPNRQLRGDDPDRSTRAQDQQSLSFHHVELAQHSDGGLNRRGQRSGVVPGHLRRLWSPGFGEYVLAVPAK